LHFILFCERNHELPYSEIIKFDLIALKGGSLKRSLGMASGYLTIPKACGFEAATES
jgi:hypothetical protein